MYIVNVGLNAMQRLSYVYAYTYSRPTWDLILRSTLSSLLLREAGILIAGLHSYTLRLHDYRSEALMKPTRSKPFLRPYSLGGGTGAGLRRVRDHEPLNLESPLPSQAPSPRQLEVWLFGVRSWHGHALDLQGARGVPRMELNRNGNCKRKNVNKKSDKQNNLHAAVTHTHRRIWMSYTCVSRFSVNTDM